MATPNYGSQWERYDYRIPKRGVPWYAIVLGITAIALIILTIAGFWIAGTAAPQ